MGLLRLQRFVHLGGELLADLRHVPLAREGLRQELLLEVVPHLGVPGYRVGHGIVSGRFSKCLHVPLRLGVLEGLLCAVEGGIGDA